MPRAARAVRHDSGRFLAMPLGGIGTGNLSIGADGGLRQWQLHNIGNHLGTLPDTFFALRASRIEPPLDVVRVLQAPPPPADAPRTPLVNDDEVPGWQRALLEQEQGVKATVMRATYPFAEVQYVDQELPLDVRMEAFTPLTPLDESDSSLPVALFTFALTNNGDIDVQGYLGGTLQNCVGGDGITQPDGNRSPLYGGNVNRLRRTSRWSSVVLENPSLPLDSPRAGQLVLAVDQDDAAVLPQMAGASDFLSFLRARHFRGRRHDLLAAQEADWQRGGSSTAVGPSAPGTTWTAGVAAPFVVRPGETVRIRFMYAWHFPNRYVNFEQFGRPRPEHGLTRFWLGNAYTRRFADAVAAAEHVQARWAELEERSKAWRDLLLDSTLPLDVVEHLAAQPSLLRSPTCFQTADGRFYGFEGVLGASTTMWAGATGGSCPLNCTHVWNYEQTLSRLFPGLERDMRDTELEVMQAPEGYVPHRVIVPTYLRQMWDELIGGPEEPALDGMLGVLLKSYREVRQGAELEWLRRQWPRLERLLDHIVQKWDPSRTGVLRGIQPSTHDIDLTGVNSYMGTYWLAALRAVEEMAILLEEKDAASAARQLFEAGSKAYDELLWNGEYYEQVLDENDDRTFQWLTGCLSDQLIGQWWAHQLDLGYILPEEHVRTALASVVRYNLKEGFRGFEHGFRVYADEDDTGLLMCSWPRGGRPEIPTRYCDEVWTGIEYQVAAHCLREGLEDEAWRILHGLWARHDGRRRNPYNEIECGDHYARAMAGWSVLEALTGQVYDAQSARLALGGPGAIEDCRVPVVLAEGWGRYDVSPTSARLTCVHGRLSLRELRLEGMAQALPDEDRGRWEVRLGDDVLGTEVRVEGGALFVTLPATVDVVPGGALAVTVVR
jgi:non-lysosomal glucosylceramidase